MREGGFHDAPGELLGSNLFLLLTIYFSIVSFNQERLYRSFPHANDQPIVENIRRSPCRRVETTGSASAG